MEHLLLKTSTESQGELEEWRKEIDKIDENILFLISGRVKVVGKIKEWKTANGKGIVDPQREAKVFSSRLYLAADLNLDLTVVSRIFSEIISLSRKIQKE